MKKSLKKFFLIAGIIICSGFMLNANAKATFTYYNPEASKYKCPNTNFILKHLGTGYDSGRGINYYSVYLNGKQYGQTFCMAPGKKFPGGGLTLGCTRVVHPEKTDKYQPVDVAITRAYQQMLKQGIIGKTPTSTSRQVGTLAFRWIESIYGKLDEGVSYSGAYVAPWVYKTRSGLWNFNNSLVSKAQSIVEDAKKYGDKIKERKTTYEELVKKGVIWSDQWEFEEIETKQNGNKVELTFSVKAIGANDAALPSKISWKNFQVECLNGYKCNGGLEKIKSTKYRGIYKVTIDISEGNAKQSAKKGRKYGLKIITAFNDQRSPYAHIMYMNPVNGKSFQKMLLIKNYNPNLLIQTEFDVDFADKCNCEIKNEQYTGNYTVEVKDENGNKTTETFPLTDTDKAEKYSCPEASTCHEPYKCQVVDGKYYGDPDKHPDGKPVDEETYKKECLHTCEKPSESNGNHYYCNEKEAGKGGEICTEKEYNADCLCPPLKTKCDNGDSSSCEEYNKKCPNCNPTISLPSDCNDFDVESSKVGIVGDINETNTACNPSVNQVKACVIDSNDITGESFEATTEINDNPYCKVWCKENYKFDVPTARHSTSGGYFTLVTTINGTRDCYVSSADNPDKPIDEDKFNIDLRSAETEAQTAYNEYTRATEEAEKERIKARLENISKRIEDIIKSYNACTTGWTNDMNFNPEIEFTYNEDYINAMNGKLDRVSGTSSTNDIYCTGDTDYQYNCLNGKITTETDEIPSGLWKTESYTTCDTTGCHTETKQISTARWIQKSKINEAVFKPNNQISTYTQYGTIKVKDPVCEKDASGRYPIDCLWTRLPDDALPVQLKTGAGVFPFEFTFKNIGQSNKNKEELGRLIGKDTSVITEYAKIDDAKKCGDKNLKTSIDGGYVCHYINDCDNCKFNCEGDNCEFDIPECEDGNCDFTCKNCAFDGTSPTYKFRTVSLNDLFPNSCENSAEDCREEGPNWNSESIKAQVTKEEIATAGEKIYDTNASGEDSVEYSYTLTPSNIRAIKEYNKAAGSYTNTTMPDNYGGGASAISCDTVTFGGIDYRVKCLSTFLSEGESYGLFTENARNLEFKLWTDTDNCLGGICLSRQDGIGPSWK